MKKSTNKNLTKKFVDPNDSIADDVRKIKESMKKDIKPTSAKKSREPAKSTPTGRSSRSAKREEKEAVKEEVLKVEEKPKEDNELKNKLLADWSDDDDVDEKAEGIFFNHFILNSFVIKYFLIRTSSKVTTTTEV